VLSFFEDTMFLTHTQTHNVLTAQIFVCECPNKKADPLNPNDIIIVAKILSGLLSPSSDNTTYIALNLRNNTSSEKPYCEWSYGTLRGYLDEMSIFPCLCFPRLLIFFLNLLVEKFVDMKRLLISHRHPMGILVRKD
jgi:hypothetical protein